MSATSVRRLKERGGGGGKITPLIPTKSLTPISQKPSLLPEKPTLISSGRQSLGKENPNPRLISRASGPAQKPVIRPMPRVSDAETRSRSRPRGRSPSPSDFSTVLNDMRKTRVSTTNDSLGKNEVLSNGKGLSGIRVLEKKGFREFNQKFGEKGGSGSRVLKENGIGGDKLRVEGRIGGRNISRECKKEDTLFVNSAELNVSDVTYGLDKCVDHGGKDGSFSGVDDVRARKGEKLDQGGVVLKPSCGPNSNGVDYGLNRCLDHSDKDVNFGVVDHVVGRQGEKLDQNDVLKTIGALNLERSSVGLNGKGIGVKNAGTLKGIDVFKDKAVNEGGVSGRVGSKSAGKLQEKLAYLEGKVKRIASDIKKTKEMLDMNNTDASKVIISDIQEKISGIEKAMGNVIADSNTQVGVDLTINLGNLKSKTAYEESQNEQVDSAKVLAKGLSCQELEARLFPHHKLLRDRTSLKVSVSGSQNDGTHVSESNHGSNDRENALSPIEDNPIAVQFLASLNKVQSEASVTNAEVALISDEVQDTEETETSSARRSSGIVNEKHNAELDLQANERLDEFDDQENKPAMIVEEEMEDDSISQLVEIGRKTSTGGWFVSEGESVLLAHDDGSCTFYDVINNEEKAEYRPPAGISQNIWRDCWIIRAAGADGCSGKYVVAASAGNTMDSGFCSWDFYTKDVRAFHIEDTTTNTRVALGPLPDNIMFRRNALSGISSENRQWWYRPCGPLVISTASCQRNVKVFDIRDGEQIMKWDVQKPVLTMDYSSPLQWRNRGKVVVAEAEAISLWDVSSLNPQALSSVSTSGRRISALHVNNTDAELGGGVRQRVSSSEAEGNDGVFCSADSINVLDFRQPSGIGLKIPKIGPSIQSVSSRGDSVYLGCSNVISAAKKQVQSQVLQLSLRKQKIVSTYNLPESNAHSHHKALTQVWGNANTVMAVCGLGLFIFDTLRDDGLPSFASDYNSPQNVKEIIGPDDLYSPSFDYLSSQILLISRDRPALWRQLP